MSGQGHVKHSHILSAIQSELWAITPEAMHQIIAVAQGFGDPEAVAAKLGRPLTNTRAVTVRDGVAIVPVIGPVFRYASLFNEISGATSIQNLATDLQAAVDDPAIKAIILEVDSPGGMVAGVSEFAQHVRAADKIKPVYGYVSHKAQSAAYWIVSAAREVVINDTSMLGSVGAAWEIVIDDSGAETTVEFVSEQSPLKRADPQSPEGRAQYQMLTNDMGGIFVETVAANRGVSVEHVLNNFGKGGSFIAAKAIAAGMADKLGSLESLIADLSTGKTHLNQRGNSTMKDLTREIVASDYPDIAKAFKDDGYAAGLAAGKKEGAEAERARIQGIEALAMPGHDALIAQLKFDGASTAAEAAMQILSAEKATRASMAAKIINETPPPVAHAPAAFNEQEDEGEHLAGPAKWEHEWKASAALQAEFPKMAAYLAYQTAADSGRVKVLGAKQ